MEILVGNTYTKEFESIFRLVRDCPAFSESGFSVEGDIDAIGRGARGLTVRDGNNTYKYVRSIANAQFMDYDGDGADDEIGFTVDGASWFRGLRGEKSAESADAQWMRFIEKIASLYHKKYSIVEYNPQNLDRISYEDAYNSARAITKFLFGITVPKKDFEEVRDPKILDGEALDIYAISVRLALSGGTGESKRVLGKIYIKTTTDESGKIIPRPIPRSEAANIDKTFSNMRSGDERMSKVDLSGEDSKARFMNVRDTALSSLKTLVSNPKYNFVDYWLVSDDDKDVISQMLKLTAHTTSDLHCSELKVLGVAHIKWNVVAYDLKIGGSPKLRVIYGLNNALSLKCLGCGSDELIVKNGAILLYADDAPGGLESIGIRDYENEETLGLSPREVEFVKKYGMQSEHLTKVECRHVGAGEVCVCYRCDSQLFEAVDPFERRIKNYCISCPRPEIVSYDAENDAPMLTAAARFSITERRMVPARAASECGLCGRYFTAAAKTNYCPVCRKAAEALSPEGLIPEEVRAARDCYRRYAGTIPLTVRSGGGKKYAFEDDGIVLLLVGKKIYKFNKLTVEDSGQMPSAEKLNFEA